MFWGVHGGEQLAFLRLAVALQNGAAQALRVVGGHGVGGHINFAFGIECGKGLFQAQGAVRHAETAPFGMPRAGSSPRRPGLALADSLSVHRSGEFVFHFRSPLLT